MSEKQQTAVEWLEFEINRRGPKENNPPQWLKELYNKAKELEKEQIMSAFEEGHTAVVNSEQYYSKTYSK